MSEKNASNKKNVTIKSIAEDMGVSFSTVSKALNNSSVVKEETRRAVRKRARELGYSPNLLAQGLRSKSTKTIGAIFNDIENVVWVHIFKRISIEMAEHGYTTLIADGQFSDGVERAGLQSFLSRLPDFVILSPAKSGAENIELFDGMLNRLIVLGQPLAGIDCHYVDVDYALGGYLSACELLKNGHREILILTGEPSLPISMQYVRGIRRAFAEHGVPFAQDRLIGERTSIENGYATIRSLWNAERGEFTVPFTAVMTFCDLMAHGVYRGLRELGKRIPQDISVIGFDDNPLSEFSMPALTTVHLPVEAMAQSCLSIIRSVLLEDAHETQHHCLQPRFVPRDSVRSLGER